MGLAETIKAIQEDPKKGLVEFRSEVSSIGGLAVVAKSRDHALVVDEPPDLGGTDNGQNPIEMLLSALGACNTIATIAFASAMGLSVDSVTTEVSGKLDLRGFLGLDGSVRPGLQEVQVTTKIRSKEPKEKLEQLAAFAEAHCPVKDTLSAGTRVTNAVEIEV
ncbi:MAG: OsmC family protein [Thermoprotei archaeon]|nr:OsmC family protein [TACK group archaeon]